MRCDWCRLDDVFLGVYDRVVEQQYLFEKKEQSALRERERDRETEREREREAER